MSCGTLPLSRLPQLCDDVDRLWINGYHGSNGINDRMPPEMVRESLSSSLLFIRPDDLRITVEEGSKGLKRVRARFDYQGERYWLVVTDPVVEVCYMAREMGHYPAEKDPISCYRTI